MNQVVQRKASELLMSIAGELRSGRSYGHAVGQYVPRRAISAAAGTGTSVVITYNDGTQDVRTGGTRAWRNNNPGNMVLSARAIGRAGNFAVFPDHSTGFNAMLDELSSPRFQPLTIRQAITRWAPPSQNPTEQYLAAVRRQLGISLETRLDAMSGEVLEALANAIQSIEGWRPGTVTTRMAR